MIQKNIVFLKNNKKKLLFSIMGLLFMVITPLPMMCYITIYPPSHGDIEAGKTPVYYGGGPTGHECYSPLNKKFWEDKPEASKYQGDPWRIEFHWLLNYFFEEENWPSEYNTVELHLSFPANPEDDHILIGAAHHVFVGKVLAQTGNKEESMLPRTQYQVQVLENIKGDLKGSVTVDHMGGYNKDGALIAIEGFLSNEYLLKPGNTYLFAARYNESENWYTLIPHPNARTLLSDNEVTLEVISSNDRVQKLKAAYPEEIPDEADVYHNNTRNSFTSLPPEAKAAAVARAEAARAAIGGAR